MLTIKERIRLVNRIRGLLKLHGIFHLSPRKKDFLNELASVRTGYGAPARARTSRTSSACRENPCLANMRFT